MWTLFLFSIFILIHFVHVDLFFDNPACVVCVCYV